MWNSTGDHGLYRGGAHTAPPQAQCQGCPSPRKRWLCRATGAQFWHFSKIQDSASSPITASSSSPITTTNQHQGIPQLPSSWVCTQMNRSMSAENLLFEVSLYMKQCKTPYNCQMKAITINAIKCFTESWTSELEQTEDALKRTALSLTQGDEREHLEWEKRKTLS